MTAADPVSRWRLAAIYGAGVVLPAAVTALLLTTAGSHGSPAGLPASTAAVINVDRVLASVAVVIACAHLAGTLAARLAQPRVIGQAVAGLALGPSLLGHAAPAAARWLHGGGSDPAINLLSQIGVVLFVFLIGRELAATAHRPPASVAGAVGAAMTAIPLLCGTVIALVVFDTDRPAHVAAAPYALFIGLLMAATALPVLAHLLAERGLLTSPVGALATGAAATGDACVWCLLAVTLCLARGASLPSTLLRLAVAVVFLGFLWGVVRPVLLRVLPVAGLTGPLVPALLIAGLLLSAEMTDVLGLHAIFGAFLFGLIMPTDTVPVQRLTAMAEGATEWLLLPLFFAAIGTRTNLALGDPRTLAAAGIVIAVATVSKISAGTGSGRLLGLSWRDSTALGVMLNCRGMTELILLSIGRGAGIIGDRLFGIFMIMALVTTAMTGPLLTVLRIRPTARENVDRPVAAGQR